jgi:beta-galactosidase
MEITSNSMESPSRSSLGQSTPRAFPAAYWRDRLRKARAMGLNTVATYVFWNMYETSPGQFDFSGQNDIAEFVREAQQEV